MKLPFSEDAKLHFNGTYILVGLIVYELSALLASRGTVQTLDHSAHLGGMATGIVGAYIMRLRSQVRHADKEKDEMSVREETSRSRDSDGK